MAKDADLVSCKPCNGSGTNWGFGADYCPLCKGQGLVPNEPLRTIVCAPCKGTGRKMATLAPLCEICGGYGSIEPPGAKPAEETAGTTVWLVRGGQPHSDRKLLASVLEDLRGDVCACDPYFSADVVDALLALKDCDRVRCLTKRLKQVDEEAAKRSIKHIKKEFSTPPEFRISSSADLHDRYVLADNGLVLLGHGLKDFGNKESFLIMLDEEFAPLETVKATFEGHWAAAKTLG